MTERAVQGFTLFRVGVGWGNSGEKYCSRQAPQARSECDILSDEALVDAVVRRGSEQHFRMLLVRYKTRVFHIALSVLGPGRDAEAEDVAQDTFITLYRRLDGFRGESRFSTWLYRLAFNQAIDHQRRQAKHRAASLEQAPEPVDDAGPELVLAQQQATGELQAALARLNRTQQVMVHLHYWLGYRVREIAEVLDCPENTVKVYLSRARQRLAGLLDEEATHV